jgi:hypothetical protein
VADVTKARGAATARQVDTAEPAAGGEAVERDVVRTFVRLGWGDARDGLTSRGGGRKRDVVRALARLSWGDACDGLTNRDPELGEQRSSESAGGRAGERSGARVVRALVRLGWGDVRDGLTSRAGGRERRCCQAVGAVGLGRCA